jgi:5-methylcytosine-specific restriction enzyme B
MSLAGFESERVAPSTGARELASLLEGGLAAVRNGDAESVKQIIAKDLAAALSSHFDGRRPVSSGTGIGTVADVPWAGVHLRGGAATAKQGIYAVYLFARDGSAVYLSFNQGTENVGGGLSVLRKRALDMQRAAGIVDAGDRVDLRSSNARPKRYEAGSAYAVRYEAGAVPDDVALRADLETMVSYVDAAVAAGLWFDPTREPLHLLFKWSRDRGPDTVEQHRAVVKDKGRTWWGKHGDKGISPSKLAALQSQLDDGVVTHAYLYGDQKLVRARLEALTDDPDQVPDDEHPAQQPKDGASLFARVSELEDLPAGWAQKGLVLASDADPAKMQGALSNQTTPLFVLERFGSSEQGGQLPTPEPPLTLAWLAEQTLWTEPELEELLEAIDPSSGKGQVILAGPPGTGKTWVAERVARYLTQDLPLHHRLVQFHPSYGYEEFVEGIRPVATDGGIVFKAVNGTVLEMAQAIEDQSDVHVLIIDELNRANVPRVFGELLYLLEYRGESITLQYSKSFALPENLRFIATMNTADRSVRSIDVALRRRFEVFECPADAEILRRFYERPQNTTSVLDLVAGFEKLNAALTTQLDRHHTIGQSFFMAPSFDRARLERTWRRQILPLIEDYFFDRPDVVADFTLESFWAPPV